jgi:flagellar basal-body rod protein FlgF
MIYVAMSGAKHILDQQASVAHNLANVSTNGYRAAASAFRAVPVQGDGLPTRTFVVDSTPGANFAQGALQQTGRDLDVAVQGPGWIAVQTNDGSEAYTRNGSLQISPNGLLQTRNGLNIVGEGGPISIPMDSSITIAKDGTVSAVSTVPPPKAVNAVGRIKLVNPDETLLVRGGDGLFRLANGGSAEADPKVTLASGALEGSNASSICR